MYTVLLEILVIILLIIANGVFAMSEMAVVSSRKARLQSLADAGNSKARHALQLADNPEHFLSTVQIGITLAGILAGAFAGATIAEQIGFGLTTFTVLAPYGEAIGLTVVVLVVTYLSLIFGELVPKRFALNNPERIASLVARPMSSLSRAASPLVWFLSYSTRRVFTLLRIRSSTQLPVTEEEIKVLLEQGTRAGVFEEAEQDIMESVFRLGDRRISAIMTPRRDLVWLDVDAPDDAVLAKMAGSLLSRFPVCRGDNVIGIVKAKEFLAAKLGDPTAHLRDFLKQPLFVPETSTCLKVLELFKGAHSHVALIIDEHGSLEGLVTTNDLLEAIVGEVLLATEHREPFAVRREDGSWLLDGAMPIEEFIELFPIGGRRMREKKRSYQTLAGFILSELGRLPSAAETFEWNDLRFEIVDMDGKRIDKVILAPVSQRIS